LEVDLALKKDGTLADDAAHKAAELEPFKVE